MYNDQVRVPLVIRTPMGGRRGYGPTHSQTLEKLFLGVPGLRVLAPCTLGNPGELLRAAILDDEDPVLFVENKLLYLASLQDDAHLMDFELKTEYPTRPAGSLDGNSPDPQLAPALSFQDYPPAYTLSVRGAPQSDLTLTAYGYMAELARQAALRLAYEHEFFVELVVPTQLAPAGPEPLLASVRRTGRLLSVEEGSLSFGWGAEVIARAAEALGLKLRAAGRLAAREMPIPASGPLEAAVLPGVDDIVDRALSMSAR